MKRSALLAAAVLLTLGVPSTAVAATPPPVPILTNTCTDGYLNTNTIDAAESPDGKIHGFAGFLYGACGEQITYFEGAGPTWTVKPTSVVGQVLDVAADSTGSYLLYVIHDVGIDEIAVVKRANNGAIARSVLGSVNGLAGGSIVARNGTWFAVWSGYDGTRYSLHQAGTMFHGSGAAKAVSVTVPTTPAGSDTNPALTLEPNGQPRLFWQRSVADGKQDLLLSSGTGEGWGTASRVAAAVTIAPGEPGLDVAVTDKRIFLTWTTSIPNQAEAGYTAVVASSSGAPGSSWSLSTPPGFVGTWDAHLVASSSSVFAAFGTGDDPHGDVYLGSKLGSAPWVSGGITDGIPASNDTFGVAALAYYGGGKTTTLVFDDNLLFAVNR